MNIKHSILSLLEKDKKLSMHRMNKLFGNSWHSTVRELQREHKVIRIYDHLYLYESPPDVTYLPLTNYLKDSCQREDGKDFLKHPSLIQNQRIPYWNLPK